MLRMTSLRRKVLNMILSSDVPLTEKSIRESVHPRPHKTSVYRALDFLLKKRAIKRFQYNADSHFYVAYSNRHVHYIICQKCKKMTPFSGCIAKQLEKGVEEETGYRISDHNLYFTGLCGDCT